LSYLFDSSSIFIAFKRDKEDLLLDNYTINLAIFELGNIIWKEAYVFRSMTIKDAVEILDMFSEILSTMKIIEIRSLKREILNLAVEMGVSYYDAAYAYVAKDKNLILVTEDKRLRNALSESGIKVINLDQLNKAVR